MKDLPSLPYDEWSDTLETLHRWSQIVGKVKLALTPLLNHWWNVPLSVSAHGLTTGTIPYGDRDFEMELDFLEDVLRIRTDDRRARFVELRPRSVADFYAATMTALREVDIEVPMWTTPVEIADPIPFEQDEQHGSYDRDYVMRFWRCISRIEPVFAKFRSGFIGKASPVQFFWGSFDLTVSFFSGRRAPPFAGNAIELEGYSHELFSLGWWPGDPRLELPSFYAYAAPEPAGFSSALIDPSLAYYLPALHGFYLEHDDVRAAALPEAMLMEFFNSTYDAAANLGAWPRAQLERSRSEEDEHALFTSQETREQPAPDGGL
jgi:hypothetical protein